MDFIFGSYNEWMGALDDHPGSTHSSLSREELQSALNAAGFGDTLFLTTSSSSFAHIAFISQGALSSAAENSTSAGSRPTSSSSSLLRSSTSESATPPNADVELSTTEITENFTDTLVCNAVDNDILYPLPSKSEILAMPSSGRLLGNGLNDDFTVVHRFSGGGEIDLVGFLSSLDSTKPYVVWLYTDTKEENTTLVGLVRTIRHEFPQWKLIMVLFHPSWDHFQQQYFIYRRLVSLKWVDAEVLVDEEGELRVARVVTAPSPPRMEAREDKPIEFDESHVWRAFPVPLGPNDVEITVAFTSLSPAFAGCSEFSGQVTAVGSNVSSDSYLRKRCISSVAVSRRC
jgi:fatty acid synthase, animal type